MKEHNNSGLLITTNSAVGRYISEYTMETTNIAYDKLYNLLTRSFWDSKTKLSRDNKIHKL
mgnify:CR=1 FL=1